MAINHFIAKIIVAASLLVSFIIHAEIQTVTATLTNIDQKIVLDAKVEAINQTTLAAQTSGQIAEILFDAGDSVTAGSVLLKLKDQNQQSAFNAAIAAKEATQAELTDATSNLSRIKDIFIKKLTSQQAFDNAKARYNIAKANDDAAIARLNREKEQLNYTIIEAPYSGIVLERLVNLGEIVSPGTPLFIGTSLKQLRIVTQIPQKDFEPVKHYSSVEITLPDQSTFIQGRDGIRFFAYASDKTATFKVRVAFVDGTKGLYPGMHLKAAFKIGRREALVIPTSAIVQRSELRAIYVQDNNSRLHLRQIRVGQNLGNNLTEVLAGVTANEKIVTNPQDAIKALSMTKANAEVKSD